MFGTTQTGVNTITSEKRLPPWLDAALQGATSATNNYAGQYQSNPMTNLGLQQMGALSQSIPNSPGFKGTMNNFAGLMGGEFLHGGSGFNAAMDAAQANIQPRVQGAFNAGGRMNSGLAQTAMSSELSNAFAGLYDSERNRQMQGLQLAPQMMDLAFSPAARAYDVGQLSDAEAEGNLDDYIRRLTSIGGVAGGSVDESSPLYENPLANALGLGLTGLGLYQGLTGNDGLGQLGSLLGLSAGDSGALGAGGSAIGNTAPGASATIPPTPPGASSALNAITAGGFPSAPSSVGAGLGMANPAALPASVGAGSLALGGALPGIGGLFAGDAGVLGALGLGPAVTGSSAVAPGAIALGAESLPGIGGLFSGAVPSGLGAGGGASAATTGAAAGGVEAGAAGGGALAGGLGALAGVAAPLGLLGFALSQDMNAAANQAWTEGFPIINGTAPVTIPQGNPGAGQMGKPVEIGGQTHYVEPEWDPTAGQSFFRVVGSDDVLQPNIDTGQWEIVNFGKTPQATSERQVAIEKNIDPRGMTTQQVTQAIAAQQAYEADPNLSQQQKNAIAQNPTILAAYNAVGGNMTGKVPGMGNTMFFELLNQQG